MMDGATDAAGMIGTLNVGEWPGARGESDSGRGAVWPRTASRHDRVGDEFEGGDMGDEICF